MKRLFMFLSLLLIMSVTIPAYAQPRDVIDVKQEKTISIQGSYINLRGYDDDTIYYSNYPYYCNDDNFPQTIRVTVPRNGHVYSGTLTYTGIHHTYGSNCVGYYYGTLYLVR